jgi:hypothetical protein
MILRSKLIVAIFVFLFASCSGQTELLSSKKFNDEAQKFFVKHFENLSLALLSKNEQCNFRESITRNLNDLDDNSFDVLNDRYLIKTYVDPNLEMHFSIVKDLKEGAFSLLCMPHVHKIMYDAEMYYEPKNDKYQLRIAREPIKLDAEFYNKFINISITNHQPANFVWRLIRATLPELPAGGNISFDSFIAKIGKEHEFGFIADTSYKELTDILNSVEYANHEIVFIEEIGYLILIFDGSSKELSVYFLPETERTFLSKSRPIKDCN